jgi:hypothetical protein
MILPSFHLVTIFSVTLNDTLPTAQQFWRFCSLFLIILKHAKLKGGNVIVYEICISSLHVFEALLVPINI